MTFAQRVDRILNESPYDELKDVRENPLKAGWSRDAVINAVIPIINKMNTHLPRNAAVDRRDTIQDGITHFISLLDRDMADEIYVGGPVPWVMWALDNVKRHMRRSWRQGRLMPLMARWRRGPKMLTGHGGGSIDYGDRYKPGDPSMIDIDKVSMDAPVAEPATMVNDNNRRIIMPWFISSPRSSLYGGPRASNPYLGPDQLVGERERQDIIRDYVDALLQLSDYLEGMRGQSEQSSSLSPAQRKAIETMFGLGDPGGSHEEIPDATELGRMIANKYNQREVSKTATRKNMDNAMRKLVQLDYIMQTIEPDFYNRARRAFAESRQHSILNLAE